MESIYKNGAVSAVTFVTAVSFLESQQLILTWPYGSYNGINGISSNYYRSSFNIRF